MYKVMGKYRGRTEVLDEFETQHEAEKMASEYRMAYGSSWLIWVKS